MPRPATLPLLIAAALLCFFGATCRKESSSAQEPGQPDSAPLVTPDKPVGGLSRLDEKTVAVVFSATESDPWASEAIATLGAEMGFDPWSQPGSFESLDVYGPYEGFIDKQAVKVSIALSGLETTGDLLSQQVLGEQARKWAEALKPALVWLDGDLAQFQVGRELDKELPILFTGILGDRSFYYADERRVTGVYERHSLPRVLAEIWKSAPNATKYSLVCEKSNAAQSRRAKFKQIMDIAMPQETELMESPAFETWEGLRKTLLAQQKLADAIIICGAGDPDGPPEIAGKPCPTDLLKGMRVPVVVLGPSRLDSSGIPSLNLLPAAHIHSAVGMAGAILSGTDALTIPTVTPEEMQVFSQANGRAPVIEKPQKAPQGATTGPQPRDT